MADHSPIGWTDATWPIVAGCEYASPGCSNCWAVRDSWRLSHNPHPKVSAAFQGTVKKTEAGALVWTGVVRPIPERLDWPLKWKSPRRIFVCSQADLFHDKVPTEFIARVFAIMARSPHHDFQVLTKHPQRAATMLADKNFQIDVDDILDRTATDLIWPLPNVWMGVTVEDQKRAYERIPHLLQIPAALRWLSVEPMLEAISFSTACMEPADVLANRGKLDIHPGTRRLAEGGYQIHVYDIGGIDWVVCGGESAQTRANTRPFDLKWARQLRGECESGGVAFFMKQLGTNPIGEIGPLPAGRTSRYKWHEPAHWPLDLQLQQFPKRKQ